MVDVPKKAISQALSVASCVTQLQCGPIPVSKGHGGMVWKNSQPIVPAILISGLLGSHLFWEVIYEKRPLSGR